MATAPSRAPAAGGRFTPRELAPVAVVAPPSARRMFIALALAALALCVLSCINLALGRDSSALRLFDTGAEANVPTWLSSAMWLASAVCAWTIGTAGRRLRDPSGDRWRLLGAVFLLLSVDETSQLHEQTVGPAMDFVEHTTGLAHAPARLVAAAGVGLALLALALWLWPWLRRLPRAMTHALVVAGVVFVSGSLGLEVLSRMVDTSYLSPLEELCEMLGVALLVATLLPCVRTVVAQLPHARD